jgi:hypothetical protein
MKFQTGIYFLYILLSIGYLSYKRIKIIKARKTNLPSIHEQLKEDYLAWLVKAKQKMPNEPSEVYKYLFLTYQKPMSPVEREELFTAFINKKHTIAETSHSSLSRILSEIDTENKLDAEFVRLLYYHFLLLSIFSEEKIKLEKYSLEVIGTTNRMLDINIFIGYLNQESFDISFIHLLPEKVKELSELAKLKSIDTNIVNFFDEDPYSGIQLISE